jgi:hypothetical protein
MKNVPTFTIQRPQAMTMRSPCSECGRKRDRGSLRGILQHMQNADDLVPPGLSLSGQGVKDQGSYVGRQLRCNPRRAAGCEWDF